MAGYRRTQIRKWRFGTNFTRYYDYEAWNASPDAAALREELASQGGATQRGGHRGMYPRGDPPREVQCPGRTGFIHLDGRGCSHLQHRVSHRHLRVHPHIGGPSFSSTPIPTRMLRLPRASAQEPGPPSAPAMERVGLRQRLCRLQSHRRHIREPSPASRWLDIIDVDAEPTGETRRGTPSTPAQSVPASSYMTHGSTMSRSRR